MGTPIDLKQIEPPAYIQAGREDHIAPLASVWRLMDHLSGPKTFLRAGSGHLAGVGNPPAAAKYHYWPGGDGADRRAAFIASPQGTKGLWWPPWIVWARDQVNKKLPKNARAN